MKRNRCHFSVSAYQKTYMVSRNKKKLKKKNSFLEITMEIAVISDYSHVSLLDYTWSIGGSVAKPSYERYDFAQDIVRWLIKLDQHNNRQSTAESRCFHSCVTRVLETFYAQVCATRSNNPVNSRITVSVFSMDFLDHQRPRLSYVVFLLRSA